MKRPAHLYVSVRAIQVDTQPYSGRRSFSGRQRLDVETDKRSRSAAGAHHLVPKVSGLESERAIHRVPIRTMSQGENELNRGNTDVLSDEKLAIEVGVGSFAREEQPLERSGNPIRCPLPSPPPVSIADVHDEKRREKRV